MPVFPGELGVPSMALSPTAVTLTRLALCPSSGEGTYVCVVVPP